ncbi:hypothetical protein KJK41_02970 [Bacillus haikouensis]|nr:hypothetical protein KJK41_02970 [Bacillus haikouensis]
MSLLRVLKSFSILAGEIQQQPRRMRNLFPSGSFNNHVQAAAGIFQSGLQ